MSSSNFRKKSETGFLYLGFGNYVSVKDKKSGIVSPLSGNANFFKKKYNIMKKINFKNLNKIQKFLFPILFGILILMNVIIFLYNKETNKTLNTVIGNQDSLILNQNILEKQILLQKEASLYIGRNLDKIEIRIDSLKNHEKK